MDDFTTAKGKSYNRTVLDLMMRYPTIFGSQSDVDQHLFLGYGTGYAWNKQGQLAYYLPNREPRKVDRTKRSILGDHKEGDKYCNHCKWERGETCCFHSAGPSIPFWNHDVSQKYSPIMFALRGQITPAPDWEEALQFFCHDVLRPCLKSYRPLILGYVKYHYPADWPAFFKRHWRDYMDMREVCYKYLRKRIKGYRVHPTKEQRKRMDAIANDIITKLMV